MIPTGGITALWPWPLAPLADSRPYFILLAVIAAIVIVVVVAVFISIVDIVIVVIVVAPALIFLCH